jgi:hypothetical protein
VYASQDGVSVMMLDILSKEQAIEDVINLLKQLFRKKSIDLDSYLEQVRDISEEQFYNLAMKKKLLVLLKQTS